MSIDDLNKIKRVHCVGVGGIGVSALARFFSHRGAAVSGSDTSESLVTDGLKAAGVDIYIGHDKDHISDDTDLVIHTIAVPADNPEILAAKEKGVPVLTYPETLGLLSEDMYTIAVSGTHGKTTTTAMLAEILSEAGKSPTVIVGSLLHKQNSNFIAGDSDILVVEACEYRRSFLNLHPDILVITNIDTDHLDYFSDLADIQSAFRELAEKVPADGFVICNPESSQVKPVVADLSAGLVDFSGINLDGDLAVPGEYNRENARAAVAAAEKLEIELAVATKAVQQFTGTWRRAEKRGELENGALVYDDYGHHPTEIRATLEGFRESFPTRQLVVAFQPHLYSRTKKLLSEFAGCFTAADKVILLPIYAARELPDPEISSDVLAEKLVDNGVDAEIALDFDETVEKLKDLADENTLILTQGAGDVYKVADALVKSGK